MKKILTIIAVCGAILTACNGTKENTNKATSTIQDLEGEWIITTVDNSQVKPAEMQDTAFLGFNVAEGALYGNAGCNSVMGSFSTDAEAGVIAFENIGSTRMMCPDMTVEDIVLPALGKVKGYKLNGDELTLDDANGQTVFTLTRRK